MCGASVISSHKMVAPRVCLVRSYIRIIHYRYTCSTCSRFILVLLIFGIRQYSVVLCTVLISSHPVFRTHTFTHTHTHTWTIVLLFMTTENTAYIISTIFVATPLFMYEMLLGQFLRLQAANAWIYIKPRWQGLAIAQFVMLLIGT